MGQFRLLDSISLALLACLEQMANLVDQFY